MQKSLGENVSISLVGNVSTILKKTSFFNWHAALRHLLSHQSLVDTERLKAPGNKDINQQNYIDERGKMLIKKANVARKLSVSAHSLDNWDDLPEPVSSAVLGKCRYYLEEDINDWLLAKINQRQTTQGYCGDVKKDQCIRMSELLVMTGLSRSKIYALIADKNFPRQVVIGRRVSVWLKSEIDYWLLSHECLVTNEY
ncbi:helix-turn-helix transcriptional regulator [Vibrio sp. ER1A]|uniref:helix-turn-helix transcriptional regulator n=1 Tax=Vibrio sp. ER1A TaxID=1517681 RepID=UPI000571A12B|nr:AlpA family phage regulatory protein [Vibrio sp. ER1A]